MDCQYLSVFDLKSPSEICWLLFIHNNKPQQWQHVLLFASIVPLFLFQKIKLAFHFTGIGTEKIVACQRVWPMQLATKVSLLLERDWAALKLLLAHCPWLFHAGAHACAGQEIPTKDSSLKVN